MKKLLALVMAAAMLMTFAACGQTEAPATEAPKPAEAPQAEAAPAEPADPEKAYFDELIAAAQAEGELVIYGSCEDTYIAAAAQKFEEKYGIRTSWSRLTGGEVQAKIEEENGNPSADIWFGGTSDPQAVCASAGLLQKYDAHNKGNLMKDMYMDADGYWYGIYTGVMGIFYNMEELDRLGLPYPADWPDLIDPQYQGLIWFSNPNTASTAKLFLNATTQMWGEEKAHEYWVALDKNVAQYTKSGGGPSKNVGIGECTIGIGFLHDAVYQISQGYDNVGMAVPASGTAAEVGAVSIFAGAKHPNAAKLFIEFALTPECVELAAPAGQFQFLVLTDAKQPEVLEKYNLSVDACIDYDFEDAKAHTAERVETYFEVLGTNADGRFKTE